MSSFVLFLGLALPALVAQSPKAAEAPSSMSRPDPWQQASRRLSEYWSELDAFRNEFGGRRDLPKERFFLFGMGPRPKFLYKGGALRDAVSGETLHRWEVDQELILPPQYTVLLTTRDGEIVRIEETESGVWIERDRRRERLPGTDPGVRLPSFEEFRFPQVMRVLHQELLVNIIEAGPVPNFFVYNKPWYRDAAMMALCFRATDNLHLIREWILGLNEVFDRNNAGETEADNPGQALFLISLVSDRNHPLVPKVLAELPRFEVQDEHGKYIKGRSDFADHPVYQTKWLKYGLRALGLPDDYSVPRLKDSYSALFWMDYRENYVPGDAADRGNYPYLGWACDHFHGVKRSPISNGDYPLTWEQRASQARYDGIRPVSEEYARTQLAAPHTWHAAEVFLYLIHNDRLNGEARWRNFGPLNYSSGLVMLPK